MHEDLVAKLNDNLTRTIALYERLLGTERGKQRAIVESDMEGLAAVLAEEEALVATAEGLEAERRALRQALGQAEERLGADFRLEHLLALLEEPARGELAGRRERLGALAAQLNEVNRLNFHLLRSSLAVVEGILAHVFGSPPSPPLYDAAGRQDKGEQLATRVDQVL